ncbi:unnamed protein product [Clavelina lepadiformis]|uniref:Uncharacterized protein n=1 Tax=Clavelina lepadiformis TaxID=159417 RepID=A0ABP0GAU4_CLALP
MEAKGTIFPAVMQKSHKPNNFFTQIDSSDDQKRPSPLKKLAYHFGRYGIAVPQKTVSRWRTCPDAISYDTNPQL